MSSESSLWNEWETKLAQRPLKDPPPVVWVLAAYLIDHKYDSYRILSPQQWTYYVWMATDTIPVRDSMKQIIQKTIYRMPTRLRENLLHTIHYRCRDELHHQLKHHYPTDGTYFRKKDHFPSPNTRIQDNSYGDIEDLVIDGCDQILRGTPPRRCVIPMNVVLSFMYMYHLLPIDEALNILRSHMVIFGSLQRKLLQRVQWHYNKAPELWFDRWKCRIRDFIQSQYPSEPSISWTDVPDRSASPAPRTSRSPTRSRSASPPPRTSRSPTRSRSASPPPRTSRSPTRSRSPSSGEYFSDDSDSYEEKDEEKDD
jgi:hypothetical protein